MVLQSIKALIGAATEHISILPEHTLHLNFDTASADFERSGNDLVISFEEGSVSIDNFFVVEGDELPSLVLVDGVEVSAHDFLSSMNPDMDLTTAAGPILSQGGGITEYSDISGNLVEGLDALGSLDTWNRGEERGGLLDPMGDSILGGMVAGGTRTGDTGPGGGDGQGGDGGNEGGVNPPQLQYLVRAVGYSQTGDSFENSGVRFQLIDENLQPASAGNGYTLTLAEEIADFFVLPPTLNPDGSFTLELSAEGRAYLEQGGKIDGIAKVEVDGHEYNMQVIATPDGSFDSAAENELSNGGDNVPLEWHNSPEKPSSNTPLGDKEGSLTGNNEAWLESIHGNFVVGSGDDTLHINKGANSDGKTHLIDMGSGKDSIEIQNSLLASGAGTKHDIRFGEGESSLTVKEGSIKAEKGAENTIISAGDTTITVSKGHLWASEGGKNSIQTGDGKDSITVHGSVWNTGGLNEINTGAGADDLISVAADIHAKGDQQQGMVAENILTTEGKITAAKVNALENGENTLTADSIKVNTSVIAKGRGAENTLTAESSIEVGASVWAENSGQNTLKGDSVSVGADVSAQINGAKNIIEAAGELNVKGQVFAKESGQNSLKGDSITVGSHANASAGGHNSLEATDNLHVKGQAFAQNGGQNTLKGNSVTVGSHVNAKENGAQNLVEANEDLKVGGQVIAKESGQNHLKGKLINVESDVSAEANGALNTFTAEGSMAFKGEIDANLGGRNELKAGDAIDIVGGVSADGGHNTVKAGASFSSRDIHATQNGSNTVEAQEVHVANTINAYFGGKNTVTAREDLTVANSITAKEGGENILAGKNIQAGADLRVDGGSAKNALTAEEAIRISGSVFAKEGSNTLTAGDSISLGKSLTANNGENILTTTGNGQSSVTIGSSLEARQNGANSILTSDGGTDISLGGKMSATSGGSNTVQAGDGTFGMSINGDMEANTLGKNSIEAQNDQAGSLHVKGGMLAGAYGKEGGENSIILGNGDNEITINGDMKATYSGSNTIVSGDGDDSLFVKNIQADGEGSISNVSMGGGKDIVDTQTLRASNKGTVNIDMGDGEGNILNVPGDGGKHTFHISATGGGTLNISQGEGDLTINTDRVQASGGTITLTGKEDTKADVSITGVLQSFSNGKIEAKGLNDLSINGTDTDGIMIYTRDSSETDISAKNITIKGTGVEWNQQGNTKDVIGVRAESGSTNTMHVGESLNIDVSSTGRGSISPRLTHGLSANNLSRNSVSKNEIIADEDAKVTIRAEAEATSGEASLAGMYAMGTSVGGEAYNIIEANDVSVEVIGGKSTNAYGMYAKSTGNGSVGSNTIEATEGHALTVSITATTSGNSNIFDAYALYSTGIKSENKIIGHSTEGTSDRITIEGDIYTSRGTNSITTGDGNDIVTINGDLTVNSGRDGINGDGLNMISTGAGDDIVSINGNIKVGSLGTVNGKGANIIETGEGNDIVYLNGKIDSADALNVNMGTDADGNDHDILVLTAGSYQEFIEQYGAWLKGGALQGAGVEQLHINGINQDDLDKLTQYFEKNVPGFNEIDDFTWSLEDTFFLDTVDTDNFNLSDLLSGYDGESGALLDFSGAGGVQGQANEFSLDGLLKNMEKVTGIKITGDADLDKVDVSGWNLEDTSSDGEGFWTFSQNGNNVQVHESVIDQGTMDEGMLSYLLNGGM